MLRDAGGDVRLTRISAQTPSMKITFASSIFEMFEEGSLLPIPIRRRRARKDKASLEAEVVAEAAIAAKADSAAEGAIAAEAAQAMGPHH